MPKASIVVPLAPSEVPFISHALLCSAGVVIIGACLGVPAAMAGLGAGGVWLWRERVRRVRGTLEVHIAETSGQRSEIQGRFTPASGGLTAGTALPEHRVALRCDYLGPWLMGLTLGGRRLWLWPDSAPAESRRRLRRLFHHPGR